MESVKKETASEITTPPGSGPCSPARPGLSPYMDCGEGKIFIPEEIYDGHYWDIAGETLKQEKVFVVLLKKERSCE